MTDAASQAFHEPKFQIQIDRHHYEVHERELTGEQLRQIPNPPVPGDRDLYEVVPGEEDRLVKNDQRVAMRDGLRFFTAPRHINPGLHATK